MKNKSKNKIVKMVKIYKYTNLKNGKVYIGQTVQPLEKRAKCNGEGYKHCLHFYSAIQRDGWDNFIPEVLEIVDEAIADEREKYYISLYDSINNGYNIDLGGHIAKSRSDQTKNKIAESGKGMRNSRAKNVCYNGIPSNMTIRDYAKEHNMSEHVLKHWCRKKQNGYSYF